MLGENVSAPALIVSGSLLALPHSFPSRSTRQRFPPDPGVTLPLKLPSIGLPSSFLGRFDANTRNEPSGAIAGSRSFHFPENGAIVGVDHRPLIRFETIISEPF